MPETLQRAFRAQIDDVSKPRRSVTAKINTSVVDRYRTVIVPSGGDFKRFTATPAVLWEHGMDPTRGRQPIGHCSSIKYRRAEDDILAVTQFKTDEYSDRIFNDYADGTLTSFSVDFIPDAGASGRPNPDEVRARPEWAQAECIYRSWELTGYSAVSYPGNPEALALAVERGLWVPDEVRSLLPPKRAMSEGGGAEGGYATKGKCTVECKDGRYVVRDAAGDPVGDFETEDEAMQCAKKRDAADPNEVEPDADDEGRTTPPPAIPEGLRTYTAEQLMTAILRSNFDPMFAIFDAHLRDIDDLARGRV